MAEPTGAFCAIHPERGAVATCDHCGRFSCPECITRQRGLQICTTCIEEGRVPHQVNPWAQREQTGFVTAWWRTILAVSGSPRRFFGSLDAERGLGEAAAFAALALFPALCMGFVYQAMVIAAFGDTIYAFIEPFFAEAGLSPDVAKELEAAFTLTPGRLVSNFLTGVVVGVPIWLVVFVFFGVLQHVFLTLIGGDTRGFEATIQAAFYSAGIKFWEVIPLVSTVSTIWLLATQAVGYSAIHRVDGWRGWVAAWGPALTCCCCLGAIPFTIGLLGGLAGLAGG